jgi:methionine sulfoxide reductase heme-binding subunit
LSKAPSILQRGLQPGPARDRLVYWGVWLALAAPLPFLLWTGLHGSMRERDNLVGREGLWAIRILIAGFALSPLARLLRAPVLRRYKRTVGLFGFTYAATHGIFYILYGRVWEFPLRIWQRRLYIPLGILSLLLLTVLAITSADGLRRWMGPPAWRRLHAVIYPLMLMISIHALWQSNIDYTQPQIYLAIIIGLLLVRLPPVMNFLLKLSVRRPAKAAAAVIS